jgi:hypothetical protein
MVKQIRLTTNSTNGIFENYFEEDVTIAPYSKIALQSISSQFPTAFLTIDGQNDQINYTVDGEPNKKSIFLKHGRYTTSDIQILFGDATTKLNKSMENTSRQLGKQWRVGTAGQNTVFQCTKGTLLESNLVGEYLCKFRDIKEVAVDEPPQYGFERDSEPSSPAYTSYFWFNSTQAKGSATFRTQLLEDTSTTVGDKFLVCYLSQPVNENVAEIDPNTIAYGIKYSRGQVSISYSYIINGVVTPTTVNPLVGDNLVINTFDGQIYFTIERETGASVDLNTVAIAYDHITDYYPVVIFGGTKVILAPSFITSDPYYNVENTENLSVVPDLPSNLPTQNFFQIVSRDLATLLGYSQSRIPSSGFLLAKDVSYVGDLPFRLRNYAETYVIELLSGLQLLSYDGLTHKRRNLLAVIPSFEQIKEHVLYTPTQLIYLDLNNNFPISLREIKAIIKRDDLTEIITFGLSQMVLLIKGEKEV